MTPEERARQLIDARLAQSGWVVQDLKKVNAVIARLSFLPLYQKKNRNMPIHL